MKAIKNSNKRSGNQLSETFGPIKVLHIAECYEAGVGHAVDTLVRVRTSDRHILLYSGSQKPSERFEHVQQFHSRAIDRIFQIRRLVREHRPDLVHLHSSWAGLYGRAALLRTPVVYQPHCYKFDDPALSYLKKRAVHLVEKFLARATSVVLALSPHEMRLARAITPLGKCFMVPNAPTIAILPDASINNPQDPSPTVIMVGRISPQKDPSFFIQVARTVRDQRPATSFLWVGDGDKSLRSELEASGIKVTGWVDSKRLTELLDSSSCYVHSASYEGFPLSILDAAARGLPIVAREIPAFESTGLAQASTPSEVGSQVLRVLSEDEYSREVKSIGVSLLSTMNEQAQNRALQAAYNTAIGWEK